jgi:hypothetical protein
MEQPALKNVKNSLNTKIYSYSETFGGQRFNLYLKVLSTPVLIRYLWQLQLVVLLHWCVIHIVWFITIILVDAQT